MEQNTLNQAFSEAISQAAESAKAISDVTKRAEAFAAIANAIAATGLVTAETVATATKTTKATVSMGSEDKAHTTHKAAAKEALTPKPDATKAKAEKEPAEKVEAKKEWTTEWTDEAMEEFSADLDILGEKAELYGDELNECIADFSSGKYKNVEEINPLNIRAFLAYIKGLEEDAAAKETAG